MKENKWMNEWVKSGKIMKQCKIQKKWKVEK